MFLILFTSGIKKAMMFILHPALVSFLPIVFFTLFIYKWFFNGSSKFQKNLPPSPPKLPVIGNLHQLGLLPHRSLQILSKKYGPLMLLHLGSKPVVVASSADVAREIMKNHDLVFSNRPKSGIPDRLTYGSKDVAFTPYGEYWRQVRSVCVLQLLSSKRVQTYRHVREEETSLMIEHIRQNCSSSVVNLTELFVTLTNDVVSRVALGRKYSDSEDGRRIMEMIIGFGELLGVFNVGDYIPWLGWLNHFSGLDAKVNKVAKDIDEFMEHLIEEHKNRKKGEGDDSDENSEKRNLDFVEILLEIQTKDSSNSAFQPESLKAMIMDMFAAGTDTTHTVMEWVMVELLRHPKSMEKLQNEVRALGQGKSEITEDDLGKMQYLKLVIKETLRLHSPVPLLVPRESTRDIKVMGYDIPIGTRVIVNAWAIGRDPLFWEKPEEFQPERFLNVGIDFQGLDFELIPFGAGRRGCPGKTFAMAINELALAKLLHKFDFALPGGGKPEDMDMTEAGGINVHRKLPILVVATPLSP